MFGESGPIKGVMLPQRPPDGAGGGQLGSVFRPPGGPVEPWGMSPVHKVSPCEKAVKPPGINAAHKKWVRQLESQVAVQKLDEQLRAEQEAAKQRSIGEFSAKLRTAILSEEDTSFWKATRKPAVNASSPAEATKDTTTSLYAPASSQATTSAPVEGTPPSGPQQQHSALDDLEGFVNSVYKEAATSNTNAAQGIAHSPPSQGAGEAAGRPGRESGNPAARTRTDAEAGAATPERPSTSGKQGVSAESSRGGKEEAKPGSLMPPAGQERPGSAQSQVKAGKAKGKASSKPAWALSQSELENKEKSEEEELLAFTEQLDFDAFIDQLDDMELKDAFQELQEIDKKGGDDKAWQKSFVRACNHAAMRHVQKSKNKANSDDEGDNECAQSVGSRSIASTRLRAKNALLGALEKKQEQWDSTTRAGDDVAQMGQAMKAAAAAEEFLIENPELRSIHSTASVKAMMGKSQVAEQLQPQKQQQHEAVKII